MRKQRMLKVVMSAVVMILIILDTKTAIASARQGIDLCLRAVIPALFPFFVLSIIINSCLLGENISLLRPFGRLCKIPKGSESLMLLGYISGYPVGAQLIADAHRQGNLSARSASRMLGFCSNAGPAFIFGMLPPIFDNITVVCLLWGVHIISGLLVGVILPVYDTEPCVLQQTKPVKLTDSMQLALRGMASVCGWVVLFRVVIGFCDRWFLWILPAETQVLISGLLELSNGITLLIRLPSAGTRFVLAAVILSFGGLCVLMQTLSVTTHIGSGSYLPGKVLQTAFSFLLSYGLQAALFTETDRISISLSELLLLFIVTLLIYCFCNKKVMAFGRNLLYNNIK